jgi:hypothetical protein
VAFFNFIVAIEGRSRLNLEILTLLYLNLRINIEAIRLKKRVEKADIYIFFQVSVVSISPDLKPV